MNTSHLGFQSRRKVDVVGVRLRDPSSGRRFHARRVCPSRTSILRKLPHGHASVGSAENSDDGVMRLAERSVRNDDNLIRTSHLGDDTFHSRAELGGVDPTVNRHHKRNGLGHLLRSTRVAGLLMPGTKRQERRAIPNAAAERITKARTRAPDGACQNGSWMDGARRSSARSTETREKSEPTAIPTTATTAARASILSDVLPARICAEITMKPTLKGSPYLPCQIRPLSATVVAVAATGRSMATRRDDASTNFWRRVAKSRAPTKNASAASA